MHADCVAWGRHQLDAIGVTGPFVTSLVKRRAWSAVWKLETPSGRYYLKEAAPGFAVEAPLLAALCAWRPASIVTLVAADTTQGWVLTRDAGCMLHDVMFDDPENGRAQVRAILLAYARLQVACQDGDAPPFADMLEDRRPAAMAQSFRAAVADDELLRAGGASVDDLARRSDALRRVDQLCRDLAALNLPLTLEHGDLHISNIMISAEGAPRIADWGDACWTTPLHGLVMCLADVAGRHKIADNDPWFRQLIEDHVSVWQRRRCVADWHKALEIVRSLVPVSGVLRWSRGIDCMPASARAMMAGQIVEHFRKVV